MFFHPKIFLYSLLYLLGLELAILWQKSFAVAFFLIFFLSLWIAKKSGKAWILAVIPVVFSISSLALLYLVDVAIQKHIFILLSAFIYYLSLLGTWRLGKYPKDQTARGMLMSSAMAAVFFFFASGYGIYLNFNIPLWVLMFSYAGISFVISYEYLFVAAASDFDKRKKAALYSALLGMSMAEIAWVINFWPFGYLTTSTIALIFYYILWDLAQSYFLGNFSQKRVKANLMFFSLLVILILLSSKWLPGV